MNASDLQIWNNAAFDNGESEDNPITRPSWSPVKPVFANRSDSLDSLSSKENQSPLPRKSLVSVKIPAPVKPLHPNGLIGNSQGNPKTNQILKPGLVEKPVLKGSSEGEVRDEKKIDAEIEEIHMEITRLSSRLEALRLEKAEQKLKSVERRGRVVPAKFMEQKQSFRNLDGERKIEESSSMSARAKVQRRGFSLGPEEIATGARRGVSLGPSEIVKSRQLIKQELKITPVQSIQNRRKSCFWKLQDIEEEKVTKERGKSLSISPKSRKTISKTQPLRQAVTTVGLKKAAKKEDGFFLAIQPKKLFKEGEKSIKKPVKPGRVVASRYNQSSTGNSALRKRSLPETDEDRERCEKKQASSIESSRGSIPEIGQNQGTQSRVKKRWEIPGEVAVHRTSVTDESPMSFTKMPYLLPRIRTLQRANNTPRDSGPAKKVAELIGRKSYFCNAQKVEAPVCQTLSFAEDVEEQ
ncbi:uncharacterized protein LOC130773352 [Actinidia eriantha]|uniref:uncharacterized protein LOC130773352 n=1 Tax=Actinidia eriantha TaxID=165200 RepID=UPI00258E3AE4|nr:uncharacterized protein LOC130773352 [Actinidia eriantha]